MLKKNIYNGFRVRATFDELHEMLTEYSKLINTIANDDAHKKYAQLIVEDEMSIACKEMGYDVANPLKNYKKQGLSVLSSAYYRLSDAEEKIKKNPLVLPDYNYFCKVTIIPYQDGFLFVLDTIQKSYLDLMYSSTEIESFEYWMDKPKPMHVSDDEWLRRGQIWTEAFGSAETETNGYTRELYYGLQNIQPKKLMEEINTEYTLERRLDLLAKNITYTNMKTDPAFADLSRDALYHEMMRSKRFQAELQELRMIGEPFLTESFTPSYLLAK